MNKLYTLALCAVALGGFAGCNGDSATDGGTDGATAMDLGHDSSVGVDLGTDGGTTADMGTDSGTPDGGGPAFVFRTDAPAAYVQFDRVGMPALSTALVPAASKDAYNHGGPNDDLAGTFATGLIGTLTGLHTALDGDISGAGLTPCAMTPAPACLTQHVGGAGGPTVQSLAIPDVVHVDTTMTSGFPNGRKLTDPVIDVTLAIALLDLTSTTGCAGGPCTAATLAGLPLNPPANDVAFDTAFPYLAAPH